LSGTPRRLYLRMLGAAGAGLAGLLASTARGAVPSTFAAPQRAQSPMSLRLLSVASPVDGGLLPDLIVDFEKQSGFQVALSTAEDVFGPARAGSADLVLSHYGHEDVDTFVLGGFGRWPTMVFSNQLALLGPPDDPAGVRGLSDLVDAFARIAAASAPFVVNDSEGVRYLGEILWNAAGRPDKAAWFVDQGPRQSAAIAAAAGMQAYTIWGLTPFLRSQQQASLPLEPMVLTDPLLQRVMVTVVVNPLQIAGVNEPAATAFEAFLLAPATQARMRGLRLPGIDQQLWWPAGRSNESSHLPR
jgi:tungstate transport system substrate-binding protein